MPRAKATRTDFDSRKEIDYRNRIEASDVSTDDLWDAALRLGGLWTTIQGSATPAEEEQRRRRAAAWHIAHCCVVEEPMPYPVPPKV